MNKHPETHASYTSYIIGFFLSVNLTLAAYFAVTNKLLNGAVLITFIIVLALLQLVVQLYFFLHLGEERGPRWRLAAFLMMCIILFITVFGTLWIMYNLDYNMHPEEVESELLDKYYEGGF